MVIGLIGESCTGKSSIGQALKESLNAEIITGKDYLKMAKSRSEAEKKFSEYLIDMQGSFGCDKGAICCSNAWQFTCTSCYNA